MSAPINCSSILGSHSRWRSARFLFGQFVSRTSALVGAALLWGVCWLISLGVSPFDRPEPLIHLFIIASLMIAVVFMRQSWSGLLNAILAGIFVLFNFLLWALFTQHLKEFTEGRELYPPTVLNNLLYGGQRWHVVVLALTVLVLAWEFRLVITRRRAVVT
jgi:hypothetical protein